MKRRCRAVPRLDRGVYGSRLNVQVFGCEHDHLPGTRSDLKATVTRAVLGGPFVAGGGGADFLTTWCSGNPVRSASMPKATIRPMRTMPR
jgi:hypothetical protein